MVLSTLVERGRYELELSGMMCCSLRVGCALSKRC